MNISALISWHEAYRTWLSGMDMNPGTLSLVYNLSIILITVIVSVLSYYLTKRLVYAVSNVITKKQTNNFLQLLVHNKFFSILGYYAPLFVVRYNLGIMLSKEAGVVSVLDKIYDICHVVLFTILLNSVLNTIVEANQYKVKNHSKPIKGLIQFIQILIFFFAFIIILSTLISKTPLALIGGLGAASAVLMLIFKDSITGLVSGVQLSFNGMVKIDDWISLDKYGVDGVVVDITLTSVKVKNWDNSISSIPSYNLMTVDAVKNYNSMLSSGARKISRSIFIDMHSVRFCSAEMLERFKKIQLIADYVDETENKIKIHNEKNKIDTSVWANGRRQTNLGIFRIYLSRYLKSMPEINQKADIFVRQQQPSNFGLPIQIYCFTKATSTAIYENIQSDIFDHILSVIPFFELNLFQSPSDMDFMELKNGKLAIMQSEIEKQYINNPT